jgi:phthalate 4,5-dioxygenase
VLSIEDNETVTQVGPGTIMGGFMREYWIPALLSEELPHPDCDPLRVRLLGEDLIAFRDTAGNVGLIANLCPHRGASLFFGRNEEAGIRCVYHGWKFDTSGACTDMPNEPPESNFKDRVRATAYPCVEKAGLVFVYMGSRDTLPPLPGIEALDLPAGKYHLLATLKECNWLQALEGDIDTVHAAFLHGGALQAEWFPEGSFSYYELSQRAPHFAAVDTDYGTIYGAYRDAGHDRDYWRIGQFLFPFWTSPGSGVLGRKISNKAWVPMDDTHTMVFWIQSVEEATHRGTPTVGDPERLPNTTDWYGRYRTVYNSENDFMIDRALQREWGSYTGMPVQFNNGPEDTAVQVSMGAILPREIEHLGTSDLMIIRTRQRLLEASRAFLEHKTPPPALDTPSVYGVRAGGAFVPKDVDWLEHVEDLLRPYVDHPDLAPDIQGGPRGKGRRRTAATPE